ncbi:hypothetical protein LTR10_013313 [Elasticomyces elasticus]|uniref:Major facilitator superfamily (MFS) profile domain-containing protein n=1 Tax=Exophiala sideris TaxID=1016849 RepID=A0ABR0J5E8_9EURO|nr:hypothetical protein LTR10_013313 [Elasticomyces elasticus]KAK5027457.1 hypothetical protein LTS07_007059 [Exophiala sideris]KAK5034839.1 hypothetical protein LTR13_006021 [Exophiala sideris]KAK5056425.1 hypothetical protein LTR69_007966 [Exophiala sideris]KAK5181085.1 hypothetical protein LTR44_006416 [Eurotiomycetes sp. CCFEE 6388]
MDKPEQEAINTEKPAGSRVLQQELLSDAEDATNREHELTFVQAIKLYPKAVGWSILMSTALVMDGYDTKLISSLFAQGAFSKAYGKSLGKGKYQISAPWQSGLTNGSNVGQIIGLSFSGYLSERFGFRKTMIGALLLVPGFIFIQFFAPSLGVLEAGQILLGIPLGIFQSMTCVYAVEVMPTRLRGYLTSYVNICWVLGQLIASGVLRGVLNMEAPWAYRVPFAVQWFWPIPLIIGVFLAPESPWWLVRKNRLEDAKASLRRLTSPQNVAFDLDKTLALMALTTEHEREVNTGTHFLACFRGTDLRRTIIVIGSYCMQVFSGSTFRAYVTYFFEQAGLPTTQAFNMSIVAYALGLIGTVLSWILMTHVGRRALFIYGLIAVGSIFLIIGGLGVRLASAPSSGLSWAIGGLLLASVFIADSAVLPVSYALVSEVPSSLLRSKSVVIARASYAVINIAANALIPYQMNPTAWGWSARTGFFWAGSCFLGLIFSYFVVPEPKDRTIAELDLLFEKKVSARNFAKAQVHLSEVAADHGRV